MFKLNAKFDPSSLLYLPGHFECDDHTEHMLTPWRLPPPLTSIMKSSLFTHEHPVHSPPLPDYMNVAQPILIILTMAGHFTD